MWVRIPTLTTPWICPHLLIRRLRFPNLKRLWPNVLEARRLRRPSGSNLLHQEPAPYYNLTMLHSIHLGKLKGHRACKDRFDHLEFSVAYSKLDWTPLSHCRHRKDQAPFSLLRRTKRLKAQLPVNGDGSCIVRVRIGRNQRSASIEQSFHSFPNKC